MKINLEGKKALVTGSTSGIGLAIATALAESGANVVITARSEERVNLTVEKLNREIPRAKIEGLSTDLSEVDGPNTLIKAHPHVDILINNVGVFEPRPFFEITDEEWDNYFQLHVMAAVKLSRHYAKGMMTNGWGRVLFNASDTSGFFQGEMVHYGTTKAALLALSRGLAESLGDSGVTSNAFIPGPTKTEKTSEFIHTAATESGDSVEKFEKNMFGESLPSSIIKRFVEPSEVADFVTFLASDQASAITGAALRVDGGIVRSLF